MKKQFFLALISILILGACGEEETPTTTGNLDNNPDQTDLLPSFDDPTNPATVVVEVPSQPSQEPEVPVFQVCQARLLTATWLCTKEDKTYKLFVNRQRSLLRVDELGTERARQRICEIELISKSSSSDAEETSETTEVIAYAHYEWGWCVRQLNVEINDIQNQEGFKCEKEGEEFADEEDTKNHNNHCTQLEADALA